MGRGFGGALARGGRLGEAQVRAAAVAGVAPRDLRAEALLGSWLQDPPGRER